MTQMTTFERDRMLALEGEMRLSPMQLDLPVTHYFGHNSYVRQMFAPAGTVAVGKIHKFAQVNILLQGEMTVMTHRGLLRIVAPYVFEAPPGAKRAAYFHKDTVWLTVHGTDKVNIDELEDELIAKSFEEFDALCVDKQLSLELV